jgi:hypothetical protein
MSVFVGIQAQIGPKDWTCGCTCGWLVSILLSYFSSAETIGLRFLCLIEFSYTSVFREPV